MKKLILMLSALTITLSTASVAVACSKESNKNNDDIKTDENKNKAEVINLSTITGEIIINWVSEYKWKDYISGKEIIATPDTLGSIDSNDVITNLLRFNLESIVMTTITGIAKPTIASNEEPMTDKLNDTEVKSLTLHRLQL